MKPQKKSNDDNTSILIARLTYKIPKWNVCRSPTKRLVRSLQALWTIYWHKSGTDYTATRVHSIPHNNILRQSILKFQLCTYQFYALVRRFTVNADPDLPLTSSPEAAPARSGSDAPFVRCCATLFIDFNVCCRMKSDLISYQCIMWHKHLF